MFQDFMAYFKLALPRIALLGVATSTELDAVYEQMISEMQSESFCGIAFFLTTWGHTPTD
jgi:hypothetical protein